MSGRLHSGFVASVRAHGQRPALTLDGTTWSYAELELTARGWAKSLLAAVPSPRRIGLLADRSVASYAGMVAILYTGAAVVPLNRKFPLARTRVMIEMADLDAVLVDPSCASLADRLFAGSRRIPVIGAGAAATAGPLADLIWPDADQDAYLLFTSGSTGHPKGVAITHANVSHFLRVAAERYQFSEHDRFSQNFEPNFDLALFDVFMAWGSGGCLAPAGAGQLLSPLQVVREQAITVWFSAPAVVAILRHRGRLPPGCLPSLRWSLFCGEPLPTASAQAWQRAAPRSELDNLYGPTEATIACLAHRWDPDRSPGLSVNGIVPIGRPFPGTEARLFGEDGAPVDNGGVGELCVTGPQVFGGYWRDPLRSAGALFPAPDSSGRSATWYRTGDLAQRLGSGEYAFIGRRDFQVKVRGHRIELGEVQAALEAQEGVVQAVAFTVPGRVSDTSDLAAVVTGNGLDAGVLLDAVRRELPGVMVPRSLHVIAELPLTINGKVDRAAIQARFGQPASAAAPD